MDTVVDRPWTTDSFLAWEDRQEGNCEFDEREVIPLTGGSVAHQVIVFNLLVHLRRIMEGLPFWAVARDAAPHRHSHPLPGRLDWRHSD
jgi:hypothetical protein